MKAPELLAEAIHQTALANDQSKFIRGYVDERKRMTHKQASVFRVHLQAALCCVIELEERIKGNPEPKRGE